MNSQEPDPSRQNTHGANMLENLEHSLKQFHVFQHETLRVHAAYLRDQLEVTGSLLALTQARFSHDLQIGAWQEQEPGPPVMPLGSNPVRLKTLPHPDKLDITFPSGHICLLTGNGTPTTAHVAAALQARGWPVFVLGFPPSTVAERPPLPEGVSRVDLETLDDAHLEETLATLSQTAGPIGAFIHLHPPFQLPGDNELCFPAAEKDLIKQVFLIAKHVKDPLVRAAEIGRSSFVTAVCMDGCLGLGERSGLSPLAGGLFGLTKSLNLEWPSVFCRAVDLGPEHNPEQAANRLLAELFDPDLQLVEVAYGPIGRSTLISQAQE